MKRSILMGFLVLFLLSFLISSSSFAQEKDIEEANPLEHFEFLVGGAWKTNSTYQTFEWGLGKKSVNSKLYFIQSDSLKLVGNITWFWHPGLKVIKGYGTAIDMQMDVFDYTTSFENPKKMINTFLAYGGGYDDVPQMETLEFVNSNIYKWSYFNLIDGKANFAYSVDFRRVDREEGF